MLSSHLLIVIFLIFEIQVIIECFTGTFGTRVEYTWKVLLVCKIKHFLYVSPTRVSKIHSGGFYVRSIHSMWNARIICTLIKAYFHMTLNLVSFEPSFVIIIVSCTYFFAVYLFDYDHPFL